MSEQKDEPVAEMSHAICAVKARVDEELQHGPIGWNLTQMDVVLADTLMSVSKTYSWSTWHVWTQVPHNTGGTRSLAGHGTLRTLVQSLISLSCTVLGPFVPLEHDLTTAPIARLLSN